MVITHFAIKKLESVISQSIIISDKGMEKESSTAYCNNFEKKVIAKTCV